MGLASEFDFLADLPAGVTLEGFLFPDTYRIDEEAAAVDLVRRMLETFGDRVPLEMRAGAATHGLSVYEMVNLAAIVEREAVLDDERALIAGVYYNRLSSGWLLAADPTVQYGLGTPSDWWPKLSLDDLQVDHPSNTYKYPSLPPGPICSPGLGALRAVAYPAETDYYFFMVDCAKGDGSHVFAVTEEEHYQNYEACGGGR
jgi:UPF0755 protein